MLGDATDRLGERLLVGQRHEAEVVRLEPVEPGAVGDEDLLGPQQVDDERLVRLDRVDLGVEAREAVEGALRFDARDAGVELAGL